MKIIGIVCSPRKNSETAILVAEALAAAQQPGVETELIRIAGLDIRPCEACESCAKTDKCKILDDMQAIYIKMQEADGIIIGSPVYFWSVSAQCKALIDRTYVFRKHRQLRNKVCGAVTVERMAGAASAISLLSTFFTAQRMIPAVSLGPTTPEELAAERGSFVIGHTDRLNSVKEHTKAMNEARALGRNMVGTINMVKRKPA